MKRSLHKTTAFSLVELTLALGVAAFALIAILGMLPVGLKTQQASVEQTTAAEIISQIAADLRAAVRKPGNAGNPNSTSVQFGLRGYWANAATPSWLYFTNDGNYISGSTNQSTVPATATFIAFINYRLPPSATTSLADVVVSWPAAAINPSTETGTPTGSVETSLSINR